MIRTVSIAALLAASAALALPTLMPASSDEPSDWSNLPAFTGIKASRGVDVEFTTGGPQSVQAEAIRGDLEDLEIYVDDDFLVVRRKDKNGWNWGGNRDKFLVTVSAPQLSDVIASSGADVDGSGLSGDLVGVDSSSGADIDVTDISAGEVRAEASSGSGISISGTCDSLRAESSSGADIDAGNLICDDVRADASSGSDIEAYATRSLRADASSGADIDVGGSPSVVDVDKSSGGDVDYDRAN